MCRRQRRDADREQQCRRHQSARHRITENGEHVVFVLAVVQADSCVAETGECLHRVRDQDVGRDQDQAGDDRRLTGRLGRILGFFAHRQARIPAPVDENAQDHRGRDLNGPGLRAITTSSAPA